MTRNVVLVTADSLRADHCGFIEPESELTPTLDALGEDGVVYERATAPGPRTPSSMPVIFSGEWMQPVSTDDPDYWQLLRRHIRRHLHRHETLPELMRANGYHTIGFTVNPWTEDTGFEQGFDRFYTLDSAFLEGYGSRAFRLADRALRGNRLGARIKWFNKRDWFIRWPDFYDAIIDAVERAEQPYFLWVFLLDTHQPYISPARYRRESSAASMYYATFRELSMDGADLSSRVDTWLRRAYRDSVRSVDGFVEALLSDRREDDPVVVFHSDHGEAFGVHGTYGHERALFRENTHVPLVVHDGDTRGRNPESVSLRHLPRILDDVAGSRTFDPSAVPTGPVISSTEDGRSRSVGTRSWNVIRDGDGRRLYDLRSDPDERRDVSSNHPEVVEQLGRVLEHHGQTLAEKRRIAEAASSIEASEPVAPGR